MVHASLLATGLLGGIGVDVSGRAGLVTALVASVVAVVLSVGRRSPRGAVTALGVAVAGLATATALLVVALVGDDFSVRYVADVSRRGASTGYRLAALWGGMAGSLLFFATVAGMVGFVTVARRRGRPGQTTVVAVVAVLLGALTALVLALADPFVRLDLPPVDGRGLSPILEHPAMLYHPPLLYLGLATLTAPFALTVAGLLGTGRPGREGGDGDNCDNCGDDGGGDLGDVPATVRRWLLVPWTLLAVGMVAGAHWAYVELGWGGYWAWDPVENTALLPWLAVTLALHAGRLRRTQGQAGDGAGGAAGSRGQAAFVCIAFLLALTGTMLTRSGAVPSVHAFAEDEAIGRALAALVAVAVAAVVALFVRTRRRPAGTRGPAALAPVVVDRLLVGQLAVVGTVLAVTFVGTVAPLYGDLTGGDGLAIEGRYFASFAGPLAVAGLALVALVPTALRLQTRGAGAGTSGEGGTGNTHGAGTGDGDAGSPGEGDPGWRAVVAEALVPAGVGAILGTGVLTAAGGDVRLPQALLAATAGAAVSSAVAGVYGTVRSPAGVPPRRRVGAHVAHAGLGLLLLGVAGTASGRTETVSLAPGESVAVLGQEVLYRGVHVEEGAGGGGSGPGSAVVADLEVTGRPRQPALVAYPGLRRVLAETSLVSTPWRDVQVALADATDDGTAVLRIGVHPLQVLVWWGALLLVVAGPLAAWGVRGEPPARRRPPRRGAVPAPTRPPAPTRRP